MRRVVAIIGYMFVALMLAGLALQVLAALRKGRPFYGENYLGLPLGAVLGLIILLVAGVIGIVRLRRAMLGRQTDDHRRLRTPK